MARYLLQATFTPEAWAGLVKNPQNRRDTAAPLLERLGGRIESYDFAFGEYDVVVIVEVPDNVSAAALSLVVAASGVLKAIKTTPLMSSEEAMAAMRKASEVSTLYRPPTTS